MEQVEVKILLGRENEFLIYDFKIIEEFMNSYFKSYRLTDDRMCYILDLKFLPQLITYLLDHKFNEKYYFDTEKLQLVLNKAKELNIDCNCLSTINNKHSDDYIDNKIKENNDLEECIERIEYYIRKRSLNDWGMLMVLDEIYTNIKPVIPFEDIITDIIKDLFDKLENMYYGQIFFYHPHLANYAYKLNKIKEVHLHTHHIKQQMNETIRLINSLTNLRKLDLTGYNYYERDSRLTDDDFIPLIDAIANHPNLKELILDGHFLTVKSINILLSKPSKLEFMFVDYRV